MKSKSIKKTLPRLIRLMIISFIVLIIPVNILFLINLQNYEQYESSKVIFSQIKYVIDNSSLIYKAREKEFQKEYMEKVNTILYFIENNPNSILDKNKMKKLAEKIGVKEILIYDKDGNIYNDTENLYIKYKEEAAQKVLKDRNLIVEEYIPDENKTCGVQYITRWIDNEDKIIQIGISNKNILKEIEENSFEELLKINEIDFDGEVHIINQKTEKIVFSSIEKYIGEDISDEIKEHDLLNEANGFYMNFKNDKYCVYKDTHKEYILIRAYKYKNMMYDILLSTGSILLYFLILSICVIKVVSWYVSKNITSNLIMLNNNLKRIQEGNLDSITYQTEIEEFDKLNYYINRLLKSIRLSCGRLVDLVDRSKIPFGVFEYNEFYNKTFVSKWTIDFLEIDSENQDIDISVKDKLEIIMQNCVDEKENIYEWYKNGEKTYLRIETYKDEESTI